MELEGFAEKSAANLLESIEKSKETTLARFIYALGIRHLGLENAKLLSKYFVTFSKFKDLSQNNKFKECS